MPGRQTRNKEPPLSRPQSLLAGQILREAFDPALNTKISAEQAVYLAQLVNNAFEAKGLSQSYSLRKLEDWRANFIYRWQCRQQGKTDNKRRRKSGSGGELSGGGSGRFSDASDLLAIQESAGALASLPSSGLEISMDVGGTSAVASSTGELVPQLSPAFAMASPHTLFPLPPADQPAGGVKREGEGGAVEVQTVSLAAEFWALYDELLSSDLEEAKAKDVAEESGAAAASADLVDPQPAGTAADGAAAAFAAFAGSGNPVVASGGGGVVAALPAFGFSRDRSRLLEAYQQGRLFGARAVSGDGQIRQLLPCLCVTRQQPPPVSPAGGERRGYDIEVEMIWTHPRARRRGLATQMLAALGGNPLPEGGADTSGSESFWEATTGRRLGLPEALGATSSEEAATASDAENSDMVGQLLASAAAAAAASAEGGGGSRPSSSSEGELASIEAETIAAVMLAGGSSADTERILSPAALPSPSPPPQGGNGVYRAPSPAETLSHIKGLLRHHQQMQHKDPVVLRPNPQNASPPSSSPGGGVDSVW